MGQGQDKIARSLIELQPTAIVELFLLYFNTVDKENSFIAFHGGAIFDKGINWQGINYLPIPVETEGFEVNANGKMARPKIKVSNKDYFVTDLLLANQDLQFAKLVRKRTFIKYLDDSNFDGGNPWGQADSSAEISNDTFVISQKTAENKIFVEFELSSPLDLENFEVNSRLIMARYCSWYYRGNGCNYQGPPIESEDGRSLIMNSTGRFNWATLYNTSQWGTGVFYNSGDPVYLENKKIIVHPDPSQYSTTGYAKIWYVCQTGHLSSDSYQPDLNETHWIRDGCNKKLNGCRKRFQNSFEQIVPSDPYSITNNFVNFTHKNGPYSTNNIVPQATITASSYKGVGYSPENIANGSTGYRTTYFDSGNSWVPAVGESTGWIQLNWPSAKKIDRIDIYKRPDASVSSNSIAAFYLYSGTSLVFSGGGYLAPNNKTTFVLPSIQTITSMRISGSGGLPSLTGLGEVAVFEPTGLFLQNSSFNNYFGSSGVNVLQNFHIASWFQFPNGLSATNKYLNIFHNVKTNCQYSGLNLYANSNNLLSLDFATVSVSGAVPITTVNKQTLQIPWDCQILQPLHVECVGGRSWKDLSGPPTPYDTEGYIRLRGMSQDCRYTLKAKDASKNFSGEYFLFKNYNLQQGIGDLKFGINDWQFSSGTTFSPNPLNSGTYSNIKYTSNIMFGTTAIWTGIAIEDKYKVFNRTNFDSSIYSNSFAGYSPRKYSEISGLKYMTGDLFAWWDMDLTGSSPYGEDSLNSPIQTLYLSGEYTDSIDYTKTTDLITKAVVVQQNKTSLPFGGFPGTDKYGK